MMTPGERYKAIPRKGVVFYECLHYSRNKQRGGGSVRWECGFTRQEINKNNNNNKAVEILVRRKHQLII